MPTRTIAAIAALAVFAGVAAVVAAPLAQAAEPAPAPVVDAELRNRLIRAQERALNDYRCLFGVDTHKVPGGCDTGTGDPETPKPLVWQSAGDSFSSGLGLEPYYKEVGSNSDGYCKRSVSAHGPVAANILRQRGWEIDTSRESMTACSGGYVEQYFNDYSHGSKRALWVQGWHEQETPKRADVLVMSFGGNDIGFVELLDDTDYAVRLNNLLDPQMNCSGLRYRKQEPDRYKCDMMIEGDIRGGIDDFYVHVVERALTDNGQLYVVGYPNLIAPYNEWTSLLFGLIRECTIMSVPLIGGNAKRALTSAMDGIAQHFNDILKRAVGRANAKLGEVRVHYLNLYQLYRTGTHRVVAHTSEFGRNGDAHPLQDYGTGGSHEYCGKRGTRTWLRGPLPPDYALHPNARAHTMTARALADLIELTHPYFNQSNSDGAG